MYSHIHIPTTSISKKRRIFGLELTVDETVRRDASLRGPERLIQARIASV